MTPASAPEISELEAQYPNLALTLLDSIPSSVLIFDRSLRVALASRNFLEKSRRTVENTVGRRLDEVFPPAILNYTQLEQRARAVLQNGRPYDGGKMTYRAPGVPQRVYYYNLAPLRQDNLVAGVLVLMHDATEEERLAEDVRRVERHLASVVESANDLVVSMEPDGRIMTWNQAAERVSGVHVAEAIGRYLADLCAPEDQETMTALLRAVRRGEPSKVREIGLCTSSGRTIPVAWACSPMWDDHGRVSALVAVGRDLTERRLLEAQLFQSAKMASLGVMAGGIAHQLRNPLGAASAAAQLLLRDPHNLELREQCAQKIYEGIKRASAIIESLLRFARPDSGRFSTVMVNEIVGDTYYVLIVAFNETAKFQIDGYYPQLADPQNNQNVYDAFNYYDQRFRKPASKDAWITLHGPRYGYPYDIRPTSIGKVEARLEWPADVVNKVVQYTQTDYDNYVQPAAFEQYMYLGLDWNVVWENYEDLFRPPQQDAGAWFGLKNPWPQQPHGPHDAAAAPGLG
jgi:PAS domain S-box-containing protein